MEEFFSLKHYSLSFPMNEKQRKEVENVENEDDEIIMIVRQVHIDTNIPS